MLVVRIIPLIRFDLRHFSVFDRLWLTACNPQSHFGEQRNGWTTFSFFARRSYRRGESSLPDRSIGTTARSFRSRFQADSSRPTWQWTRTDEMSHLQFHVKRLASHGYRSRKSSSRNLQWWWRSSRIGRSTSAGLSIRCELVEMIRLWRRQRSGDNFQPWPNFSSWQPVFTGLAIFFWSEKIDSLSREFILQCFHLCKKHCRKERHLIQHCSSFFNHFFDDFGSRSTQRQKELRLNLPRQSRLRMRTEKIGDRRWNASNERYCDHNLLSRWS